MGPSRGVWRCGSGEDHVVSDTKFLNVDVIMKRQYPSEQDLFLWLKRPTIANVKAVLTWAGERAMRTDVDCSDKAKMVRRQSSDKPFEEVVRHINGKSKSYFRVILRKNRNWFLLLTDKLHIEDMLEIGIRGVEIDGEEYFTFSYLKKEMLSKLRKNFLFGEDIV